ncbi:MAG: four helix bundle protein [Opitutaceae bacterium]
MSDELNTSGSASEHNSALSPQYSSFAKGASIVERSFEFSVRVVRLCRFLDEQDRSTRTLASQLLRSGTSIGANIEEAQAGQSKADFTAKMSIARKEARETLYWLRLLNASEIMEADKLTGITKEADELVRILTSIVKTAQSKAKP